MLRFFTNRINLLSCRHAGTTTDTSMTVGDCIHELKRRFTQLNMTEAVSDISYLISHAIGLKTLEGVRPTRPLTPKELKAIHDMAKQRLERMPVQYIVSEWDFRDLTLDLKPPVFIPRPETEELVEHILAENSSYSSGTFLEIGPGSGAIALSLLKHLPNFRGMAIDKSEEACNLTKQNAEKLGLLERLTIQLGEIGKDSFPFEESAHGFDLLVSNPPYIPSAQMMTLQPEILLFEDHDALNGGKDGLDITKSILKWAPRIMKPNSSIWLEVDSRHPDQIKKLLKKADYRNLHIEYIKTINDFNSLPRFCHLQYNPT